MDLFTRSKPPDPPLPGRDYVQTLHRYLRTNFSRLAPTAPPPPTFFQQSYTLLTLGLDPSSQPLSRSLKVPLTLGFGAPTPPKGPIRPLTLRLPPDRLLYLLLRWQALPQSLPHVGRTDVPVAEGVPFTARGAAERETGSKMDGDVQSVQSWVGSMRSVSLGSMGMSSLGKGWWGKEEPSEALYSMFTVLPALLIHPPFFGDRPIAELVEAGGYTQFGGVDVRVPLDVMRNLQVLELEGYDPRALLIPLHHNLRSLTVRDVQDGDDWIKELLTLDPTPESDPTDTSSLADPDSLPAAKPQAKARFPHLRHLRLHSTSLLSFPTLPLTSLTSLDLSYNLLNAVPPSLSHLPVLTSLNLSHNLITSVRNAPTSLGDITTLNISHNRIDCLVGLERVMGLERVDVRSNELLEGGEVGRLAVLPNIKEVWASRNPFDQATGPGAGGVEGTAGVGTVGTDGWRVELGTTFAVEGKDVILDDKPFSWTEQRAIDSNLARKGRSRSHATGRNTIPARTPSRPHSPHQTPGLRDHNRAGTNGSSVSKHTPSGPSSHHSQARAGNHIGIGQPSTRSSGLGQAHAIDSAPKTGTLPSTSANATVTASAGGGPSSPMSTNSNLIPANVAGMTPGQGLGQKKRRPRRMINLDSTEGEEVRGGSMRLPPKSVMLIEDEHNDTIALDQDGQGGVDGPRGANGMGKVGEGVQVKKVGRRGRVSASMFEPH